MQKKHLKRGGLLLWAIFSMALVGCDKQAVASEAQSYSMAANAPFVIDDNGSSGSEAQSFIDEFSANGEREADYHISPEQIVKTGETVSDVNMTDFHNTRPGFDSKAEVKILSAQIVTDLSELPTEGFVSAEIADADGSLQEAKLALVQMEISNTGAAAADFVYDSRMYRVSVNDALVSLGYDFLFSGIAYFDVKPPQTPYGSLIRLEAGETVTVSVGYFIPTRLITQDTVLYYELNAHEDSFFYDTGRKEVYFVEVTA